MTSEQKIFELIACMEIKANDLKKDIEYFRYVIKELYKQNKKLCEKNDKKI